MNVLVAARVGVLRKKNPETKAKEKILYNTLFFTILLVSIEK